MEGKTILIDEYDRRPLKVVESVGSTPNGEYSKAVLATLYGVLSDYGHETRNDRWYTGSLWKKVLNDSLFKEAIAHEQKLMVALAVRLRGGGDVAGHMDARFGVIDGQ